MRNVSNTTCVENQNTRFVVNNFFFENRAVYEKMSKKYGGARGDVNDVTIWRIRVASCISKATCTHTLAYARTYAHTQIFIAFPRQE